MRAGIAILGEEPPGDRRDQENADDRVGIDGAADAGIGAAGYTNSSPCSASGIERITGDDTASACTVEQTSCTKPRSVSAADRHDPPTVCAPSRTRTDRPARASSIAAHSPLGPEPMTMAS